MKTAKKLACGHLFHVQVFFDRMECVGKCMLIPSYTAIVFIHGSSIMYRNQRVPLAEDR